MKSFSNVLPFFHWKSDWFISFKVCINILKFLQFQLQKYSKWVFVICSRMEPSWLSIFQLKFSRCEDSRTWHRPFWGMQRWPRALCGRHGFMSVRFHAALKCSTGPGVSTQVSTLHCAINFLQSPARKLRKEIESSSSFTYRSTNPDQAICQISWRVEFPTPLHVVQPEGTKGRFALVNIKEIISTWRREAERNRRLVFCSPNSHGSPGGLTEEGK